MITLEDLFTDLATTDIQNFGVVDSDTNLIRSASYNKILNVINLGLRDIYTRFNLKEKEFKLYQQNDIDIYYLRSEYLEDLDYMDEDGYIEDSEIEPFDDDIVKIINAVDTVTAEEIPINNDSYPEGIFLLAPDILKITPASPLKIIKFTYQAYYPKVVWKDSDNPDPAEVKLYIPSFIKNALYSYIASKIAPHNERNLPSLYSSKYERDCILIDQYSLSKQVLNTPQQFEKGGWV